MPCSVRVARARAGQLATAWAQDIRHLTRTPVHRAQPGTERRRVAALEALPEALTPGVKASQSLGVAGGLDIVVRLCMPPRKPMYTSSVQPFS